MKAVERVVRRLDAYQQRHRRLSFLFAVVKKYGDDRSGPLAALLAYYGFLALFPLLLLLTTILGFVLGRDPRLERAVLHSALSDFPIIGDQLRLAIRPLRGSAPALAVGLAGLVWGALGVTQVAQHAMAEVWNVPGVVRPNLVTRVLRGFGLFMVLGLGVTATTVLASLSTFGGGPGWRLAAAVSSIALNVGLYLAAFRVTTVKSVATAELVPGAVVGGVAWSALQALGSYLVAHQLRQAGQVYGFFGSVLGLLWWLFLGAQVTLYAAELNVVWARKLWPRSLVQPPLTEADKQILVDLAVEQERRPEQSVSVSFDDGTDAEGPAVAPAHDEPARMPSTSVSSPGDDRTS